MIHKCLTSETWNSEQPRVKDRVGDKIYYKVNSSSEAVGSIRQELDMMKLSAQHGIPVPRVWSYTRVEELEVCTIEYVEGTPLDKLDPNDPLALKAKSVVESYIRTMESVQRPTTLNNQHPLGVQSLRVPATSSDVGIVQFHAQRYRLRFPEKTIRELGKLFPAEPCVLAHGDLAGGSNAVVCADGTVKLIDWECAGFLPLHISRAVSETLDVSSRLGGMIGSLCAAAQSGPFGERDQFETALADFVRYVSHSD